MPIIQTSSLPNQLNELALLAGAGGGILGGKLLGWRTVCAVEWDAYARDVLVARQNDGCLHPFPIWDDIQTFDGHPWRGCVDVVSGGFPCQDISAAGKGAGIEGERSGMWKHMARIIGEVRPRFVLVENSPMLVGRGLGMVLGHLAEMGYDARWGIVGAHHAAAPHKRDRIWIVADAGGGRCGESSGWEVQQPRRAETFRTGQNVPDALRAERESGARRRGVWEGDSAMADASGEGLQGVKLTGALREEREWTEAHGSTGECGGVSRSAICNAPSEGLPHGVNRSMGESGTDAEFERSDWWATEPDVGRVANGVAARVDRLRCIGNGQVPAVVPLAWSKCGDDESADGKHERLACNA